MYVWRVHERERDSESGAAGERERTVCDLKIIYVGRG